jgi:precorrin-4/cobalt-precorrin-4 C11-methyltransferase
VVYRASWPDQRILWTNVTDLARDMSEADVNRQALILVGPAVEAVAVGQDSPKSKLYDAAFSHGYRSAKKS